MKTTEKIYIGSPLTLGSEVNFLRRLAVEFPDSISLIFANFFVGDAQIDFLVVTPDGAALIEHKQYEGPIVGERNGLWQLTDRCGASVTKPNAYLQAVNAAYSLSDAMTSFRKGRPEMPAFPQGQGFRAFRNFVSISPRIAGNSQLTPGDRKAFVKSSDDVIDQIRQGYHSVWSVEHWRRFALEHLKLNAVTLSAAVDRTVLAASKLVDDYRSRLGGYLAASLPPLIDDGHDAYGAGLVNRLADAANVMLLGPGGATKSFHALHVALEIAKTSEDEVPIVIEPRRYRGGEFMVLVRQSLAHLHAGDVAPLISGIQQIGCVPILIVDGINECRATHVADLKTGIVAFAVQYGARTIVTAQEETEVPGLVFERVGLALPNEKQRRAIYAYHAGVPADPNLDPLCAGFRNAYEVSIAGRCHLLHGRPPASRAELYDRYVAACLPPSCPSKAAAVLGQLADEMGSRGTLYLSRTDCETIAQRVLQPDEAPLSILDDLLASVLLDVRGDLVVFEHELLVTYLRSTSFVRQTLTLDEFRAELRRPVMQPLIEMLLTRLGRPETIEAALLEAQDPAVLIRAAKGLDGARARQISMTIMERFLSQVSEEIELVSVDIPRPGEATLFDSVRFVGGVEMTDHDHRIAAAVVALQSEPTIRTRLFALLDAVDSMLAREVAARGECKLSSGPVLQSEILRLGLGVTSPSQPRAFAALQAFYTYQGSGGSYFERFLDSTVRSGLVSRARRGSFIALYTVLRHPESPRVASEQRAGELLQLIITAWQSGIPYLQMQAMETLSDCARQLRRYPGLHAAARTFVDPLTSANLFLSTTIVDAMNALDMIDSPVSKEQALQSARMILDREDLNSKDRSSAAYGFVSGIFEDVYQGAYYEAYHDLEVSEQVQLLVLATASESGFFKDWIMMELIRHDDVTALPAFRRAAHSFDLESMSSHEAVSIYVLAHYGYARFAESPPPRSSAQTPLQNAWNAVGDALFWAYHDGGRFAHMHGAAALNALLGDDLLASALVLADVETAASSLQYFREAPLSCIAHIWPDIARRIASTGLLNRSRVAELSVRPRIGGFTETLVKLLAEVGDDSSLDALRSVIEDPALGPSALAAVRSIEDSKVAPRKP